MLNPFPIQFLALFAYAILRICIGFILVRFGIRHLNFTHSNPVTSTALTGWQRLAFGSVATIELVLGLTFIVGFLTQIAALGTLALIAVVGLFTPTRLRRHLPDRSFCLLLGAAALSLFITGAGVFAFDLPL